MGAPFLDSEALRSATFARYVEIHETLDSTNNRAVELAREAAIELPALVVARHQTAGRGRGRNAWWSADGALTFSLVLEPVQHGIATMNWPQLSLATAVAVCDTLQPKVPAANCGIKWPNDVFIDGSKVCGILIESPGGVAPAKDRLIVGIGINVNNSWQTAPRDVGPQGTALCDVTGNVHDLQTILVRSLQTIQERLNQLAAGDPQLPESWQRLCWLTEQSVEVKAGGRWITGACTGIDGDGALMIEDGNGIHRVHSGSVRVM
jgi:BirA family biotin operon repressor/biotin-[acetyl-CoA-carboxylase] ligase